MGRFTMRERLYRRSKPTSFTLVELLVVITIILILATLTLWAAQGLMTRAARSRALAEMTGYRSGLEAYKNDNGIYPPSSNILGGTFGAYPSDPSTNGGTYQVSSQILYEALSGKVNFNDTTLLAHPYVEFKITQLGNYKTGAGTAYSITGSTYVQDPWSYAWGYSTGDGTTANVPCSGSNFYDLWSTAGLTTTTNGSVGATNAWVANWRSQ